MLYEAGPGRALSAVDFVGRLADGNFIEFVDDGLLDDESDDDGIAGPGGGGGGLAGFARGGVRDSSEQFVDDDDDDDDDAGARSWTEAAQSGLSGDAAADRSREYL